MRVEPCIVISQNKAHSYKNDTLLSIGTISSPPQIASVAKSLTREIRLSICLPLDQPPLTGSCLSPEGNTEMSFGDFSVMGLQDKLHLMIHPVGVVWLFEPGHLPSPFQPSNLVTRGQLWDFASQETEKWGENNANWMSPATSDCDLYFRIMLICSNVAKWYLGSSVEIIP